MRRTRHVRTDGRCERQQCRARQRGSPMAEVGIAAAPTVRPHTGGAAQVDPS